MPRKTTKTVDRKIVLEAFNDMKELSSMKIGQLLAELVRDNHVSKESVHDVDRQIKHIISESVNTILSTRGV